MAKNNPNKSKAEVIIPPVREGSRESALTMFQRKVSMAVERIPDIKKFRESDEVVDYVLTVGSDLFKRPLDQHGVDELLRTGGRLVGGFAYLGQKAAYARAMRDINEQKSSEVEKHLVIATLAMNSGYKVTQARAEVALEIEELKQIVITLDAEKNQWESIVEACDRMVSFVQTAIRVKEGERFKSHRIGDQ